MAVVLITHDLALVAEEADRVAVMYAGNIVETGTVAEVFANPKHPYTKGLLNSVPVDVVRGEELKSIGGSPPELHSIPTGCVYQARCPLAREICGTTRPELRETGPGRKAACHFPEEVAMSDQQRKSEKLLEVRDLTKTFRVPDSGKGANNKLCALDGISLDLARGETLGLVGESGCGKSTLARTLMMLERPDSGTVAFDGIDPFTLGGKDLMKFRRRVQMVFQDPYASLNARMTAADIISEPWRTHKTLYKTAQRPHDAGAGSARPGRARRRRGGQVPAGVLRRTAPTHRHRPRTGARTRTSSSATSRSPHWTSRCRRRCSTCSTTCNSSWGISYIFISHDLSVVRHVADRVSVMYLGRIIESGPTEAVFDHPDHPYTAALMSAAPKLDAAHRKEKILLKGEIPSPLNPPSGCRFRTRCWKATEVCATTRPPLVVDPVGQGHTAECHHPLHLDDDK